MAENWLVQTHRDYARIRDRETYTWDHYTGECQIKARNEAKGLTSPAPNIFTPDGGVDKLKVQMAIHDALSKGDPSAPYLLRRSLGEALAAYIERVMVTRYPRHFQRIMGSVVGGISMVDDKAERVWETEDGRGLGDPMREGTPMSRIWRDADGQGTNYTTLLHTALTNLVVSHRLWYLVDPHPEGARIILWDPRQVDNWLRKDLILSEVKSKEEIDVRTSLMETEKERKGKGETADRWVYYTTSGYSRWKLNEKKEPEREEMTTWKYPFYTDRTKTRLRLPIGCVKVPLRLDAGHQIAMSCNSLYNMLSDVRNLLRVANHPQKVGKNMTDQQVEKYMEMLARGSNFNVGDIDFINPDPSNAKVGYEIYKEEVREVYVEAYQTLEDAAQQRTATEVAQDETRGRRSILSVVTDAMDEFENDVLFLRSQIEFPERPELWHVAHVDRSKDFKPLDPEGTADRIMREIFPRGVEWPQKVEVELLKKVLEGYGVDVPNLDELLAETLGVSALTRVQEAAQAAELNGLGLPA